MAYHMISARRTGYDVNSLLRCLGAFAMRGKCPSTGVPGRLHHEPQAPPTSNVGGGAREYLRPALVDCPYIPAFYACFSHAPRAVWYASLVDRYYAYMRPPEKVFIQQLSTWLLKGSNRATQTHQLMSCLPYPESHVHVCLHRVFHWKVAPAVPF